MADPVSVCNMALGFFGGGRVTGIADADLAAQGDEAALCNSFFNECVLSCLEDGAWLFATQFVDMGAPSASPYQTLGVAGFGSPWQAGRPLLSQFVIPPGMVSPLQCDDGSGNFQILFERNGKWVLSESTAKLLCRGVFSVLADGTDLTVDMNYCTPNFRMGVAYRLASLIVGPLTQSQAKIKEYKAEYEMIIKKARMLDGMAGTAQQRVKAQSESIANWRGGGAPNGGCL